MLPSLCTHRERVDRILSRPLMFDAMVPQWLPEISPGERLGIRINSGWHQVQRLNSVKEAPDPVPYELFPTMFWRLFPIRTAERKASSMNMELQRGLRG